MANTNFLSLFQVTVDDFLFKGYTSGALKWLGDFAIDKWELDDPKGEVNDYVADLFQLDNEITLLRAPYVIQLDNATGDYRFAALNTKSGTTHNEYAYHILE